RHVHAQGDRANRCYHRFRGSNTNQTYPRGNAMTTPSTAVLPRIAIVGRPNVGKSSIFNRIVGERRAIIEDEPGTTRDRVEADVEWLDVRFRIIDTGGFETESENAFAPY